MENEDLLKLKETFITELANIDERIKNSNDSLLDLEEKVSDPLDKAMMNEERERTEANLKALKLRSSQINRALIKLENDEDYGLCVSCDEEIGTGRLNARPEAVNCIVCSKRAEEKERMYA